MSLPVRVTHSKASDEKAAFLATVDICSQGAYLEANDPLPVGTRLEMDIILQLNHSDAKDDIIRTSGEVIRKGATGMAVRFDERYKVLPITYFSDQ